MRAARRPGRHHSSLATNRKVCSAHSRARAARAGAPRSTGSGHALRHAQARRSANIGRLQPLQLRRGGRAQQGQLDHGARSARGGASFLGSARPAPLRRILRPAARRGGGGLRCLPLLRPHGGLKRARRGGAGSRKNAAAAGPSAGARPGGLAGAWRPPPAGARRRWAPWGDPRDDGFWPCESEWAGVLDVLGYGLCGSGGHVCSKCRRLGAFESLWQRGGRAEASGAALLDGRGLVVATMPPQATKHAQSSAFILKAAARPKLLMPNPVAQRHRRSHTCTENTRKGHRPTAPHGAWRLLAVVPTPQPARPGEPPRWGRHQQLFMSSRRRLSEPSCGRHEAAAGASSAGHRPLGRRPAPGCAGPAPTARPPTSWRCLPPRSAHP